MQKWEYRTVQVHQYAFWALQMVTDEGRKELDAGLEVLGNEGWELIATVRYPDSHLDHLLYFKRPRP